MNRTGRVNLILWMLLTILGCGEEATVDPPQQAQDDAGVVREDETIGGPTKLDAGTDPD